MRVRAVFALASMVVVAAPGVAAAQETVAERQAVRAETPWYERFTFGQQDATGGLSLTDRRPAPTWTEGGRWTVRVEAEERTERALALNPAPRDTTALGAFYHFTPRVRVGGQVRVSDPVTSLAPAGRDPAEPDAGVKLESAFRF